MTDDLRERVRERMDAAISQGFLDGTQHTASLLCADVAIALAVKLADAQTKAMVAAARELMAKHGESPERKRLERAVGKAETT